MEWNQLRTDAAKLSTIALIQNARSRVKAKVNLGEGLGVAAILDELADRLENARQREEAMKRGG